MECVRIVRQHNIKFNDLQVLAIFYLVDASSQNFNVLLLLLLDENGAKNVCDKILCERLMECDVLDGFFSKEHKYSNIDIHKYIFMNLIAS